MNIDPRLYDFATDRQAEVLKAIEEAGSERAAARKLGLHHSTVQLQHNAVKNKAAARGYAPEHDMVDVSSPAHLVKGASTLYKTDETGVRTQKLQWVKTELDRDARINALLRVIESQTASVPRLKPVAPPKGIKKDLANLYTLTDCHIGMYADEKMGGAGWDNGIAERTLTGCFQYLLDNAPDAEVGIIAQLGDFLHFDGMLPVTPKSRHILDTSSRFEEIVDVAVRVLRRIVDMALKKHKKVVLVLCEGNHDEASSIWMQMMFQALYENEPRIEVVTNRVPYYAYQWGDVFLGWHHSHLKNMANLPLYFAQQFAKMWGDTKFRYGHTGDKHHSAEKEYTGIIMTQHPTLAAKDAYTVRHGWHALRTATAFTYHKKYGRISSVTANPEILTIS